MKRKMAMLMSMAAVVVATALWFPNHFRRDLHSSMDDPASAALDIGRPAPNFTLPDLRGHPHSLAGMRGKTVRLAFFCGCERCIAAAKRIAALNRRHAIGPFVSVVALGPDDAGQFAKSTGIKGIVLTDPDDKTAQMYASDFCPRLWLISPTGKITYFSATAADGKVLDAALKRIAGPMSPG